MAFALACRSGDRSAESGIVRDIDSNQIGDVEVPLSLAPAFAQRATGGQRLSLHSLGLPGAGDYTMLAVDGEPAGSVDFFARGMKIAYPGDPDYPADPRPAVI
jgi:hypothetical protein